MYPHSSFRTTAFLSLAIAALFSACSDSTAPDTVPAEVAVNAVDTLRSIGANTTLTATVRNASHQTIPGVAVSGWESSDPTVLTVNATTGLATAIANGAATITARVGTLTGSTTVIVHQRVATVTVTGSNVIGSLGSSVQLAAAATDAGGAAIAGRALQWSSSNPAVASIDAASGLATALSAGTVTLRATIDGTVGNHDVSVVQVPVSVTLVPPTDTLRSLGATGQYTAVVRDSGGSVIATPGVDWESTNPAIVTIHRMAGFATAVSNGSVFVRALAGPTRDSVPLTVRQRIDPARSTISVVRPLLFVDDTVRVTLQARDALNNPLAFGGATVAFSSSGGTSTGAFLPVVDNLGTYSSDFVGVSRGSPVAITASVDGGAITSTLPTLRVVGFTRLAAAGSSITIVQTTTTGGFTCGIITTSDMYCWGIPLDGVRGNGTSGSMDPGLVPTLVGGGHQWTDVAAGNWFVCAVATGGGVYCWGDGDGGQLGNGSSGNLPDVRIPTPISGSGTFGSVSIGLLGGTCAVTLTKAAMCWGSGTFGRLGNGSDTLAAVPVAVNGGHSFDALSTTFSGACGIAAASAYCWGQSLLLGTGGSAPDTCAGPFPCAKTPVAVSGGHVFRPIVALDGNVACAAATDNQTYCWGSGYLGNGTTGIAHSPTPVSGGLSFTTLAAGDAYHCGTVAGGAAWCWGGNRNGRLGNGTTTDALVPTAVSGGHAFTQLSSSQDHTCGIATDGNAFCWGGNDKGELGTRSQTASHVPARVQLFSP